MTKIIVTKIRRSIKFKQQNYKYNHHKISRTNATQHVTDTQVAAAVIYWGSYSVKYSLNLLSLGDPMIRVANNILLSPAAPQTDEVAIYDVRTS